MLLAAQAELEVIERFMRYCYVMRERKMQAQREMFGNLGIGAWRARELSSVCLLGATGGG
jgi:hypothetical protein